MPRVAVIAAMRSCGMQISIVISTESAPVILFSAELHARARRYSDNETAPRTRFQA